MGEQDAHIAVHEHADIEVGVSQPVRSLLQVGDCSQNNLCIEVVRDCGHILAFNWKLHVEQRQVEAELSVACKQQIKPEDSFTACKVCYRVQASFSVGRQSPFSEGQRLADFGGGARNSRMQQFRLARGQGANAL